MYIKREDAIKAVKCRFNADLMDRIDAMLMTSAIAQITKNIANIPAVEPKWIPCEERLPEPYTVVMVSLNDEFVTMGAYRPCDKRWTFYAGAIVSGEYPVAWMPLPEPYKRGEDNE